MFDLCNLRVLFLLVQYFLFEVWSFFFTRTFILDFQVFSFTQCNSGKHFEHFSKLFSKIFTLLFRLFMAARISTREGWVSVTSFLSWWEFSWCDFKQFCLVLMWLSGWELYHCHGMWYLITPKIYWLEVRVLIGWCLGPYLDGGLPISDLGILVNDLRNGWVSLAGFTNTCQREHFC